MGGPPAGITLKLVRLRNPQTSLGTDMREQRSYTAETFLRVYNLPPRSCRGVNSPAGATGRVVTYHPVKIFDFFLPPFLCKKLMVTTRLFTFSLMQKPFRACVSQLVFHLPEVPALVNHVYG